MGSSIAGGGGAGDYVNTATSINWGNPWTMFIWVYPTALSGVQLPINASNNNRTYPLHFNGTTAKCKDNGDTSFVQIGGFSNNKWWCVATSANGSNTTNIYSGDGNTTISLGDTNGGHNWINDTRDVYIASKSDGWPFIGNIAHLHVYTRMLSLNELIEIQWNPGSIVKNLEGYYPLIDNVNIVDLSGNAIAGTVNGTINNSTNGPPIFYPKLN